MPDLSPGTDVTCDAFFNGAFHLLQPARGGLRSGDDALLLAATAEPGQGGRAADLGSGAGAVALAVAVRAPALSLVLAERDPLMADLARRTLALPANAALAERLEVAEIDLLRSRPAREAAGLSDGVFDLVLTNPPFHPAGGRVSPDPMRAAAKGVPGPGFTARWVAVAGALLAHGGAFRMIARPDAIAAVADACENRFGALRIRPIHPRPDAPAIRILVAATRGSRAPLSFLPPVVLDAPTRAALAAGSLHIAMA